jgi:hypothetical protein
MAMPAAAVLLLLLLVGAGAARAEGGDAGASQPRFGSATVVEHEGRSDPSGRALIMLAWPRTAA